MVSPAPVDEPVPDTLRCTVAADCAAYEPLPCCSKTKEAVNQAGLEAAKKGAESACAAVDCAPDLRAAADDRVPACEAGECTLVFRQ
jgi:hypothetical protein